MGGNRKRPISPLGVGGNARRCLKLREKADEDENPQSSAIVVSEAQRRARDLLESQRLAEVAHHVVNREVHPLDAPRRCRGARCRSSQDLARPPHANMHDTDAASHCWQEFHVTRFIASALACSLAACASTETTQSNNDRHPSPAAHAARATGDAPMDLGNFSVSLSVKNLTASRAFYENLGFRKVGGDPAKNWLILQNETATIGLFQGVFEKNTLTFNPGWNRSCETLPDFEDVRDIQRVLKSRGMTLAAQVDDTTSGPAFVMMIDPDGNPVLIDQHVPSPRKTANSAP
jgi:catechol 2,3-dioxygenase-like lactoylglutathione lyase family enzyme